MRACGYLASSCVRRSANSVTAPRRAARAWSRWSSSARTGEAPDAPGAQPLPVDGAADLFEALLGVAAEKGRDIAPRFQGSDETDLAIPGVGVENVAGDRGAPDALLEPLGSTRARAGSMWRASARCWCRRTLGRRRHRARRRCQTHLGRPAPGRCL